MNETTVEDIPAAVVLELLLALAPELLLVVDDAEEFVPELPLVPVLFNNVPVELRPLVIGDERTLVNDIEPGTIDLRCELNECLLPVAAATATAAAALKRLVEFDRDLIGDDPQLTEARFVLPVVLVLVEPTDNPYRDANIDDVIVDEPAPGLNDCR